MKYSSYFRTFTACSVALTAVFAYYIVHHVVNTGKGQYFTDELIRRAGYPCEEHKILTKDGYILTVFRIPHGRDGRNDRIKPAFWLQHGLTGSSDLFVLPGPDKALAFLLADRGFDVWLGNARGNTYSKEHTLLNRTDPKFWDFSWDDFGKEDLPSAFDYVLERTNQKKMYYAGHSMGSTMLMVFLAKFPRYQDKIEMAFALAPAVYMGHCTNTLFNLLSGGYAPMLEKYFGPTALLPLNMLSIQDKIWPLCTPNIITRYICGFAYEKFAGASNDYTWENVAALISITPGQTSAKTAAQFGQTIKSGKFHAYDYGKDDNIKRYRSEIPPLYDLKSINVPMALIFTDGDNIASPYDVYELCLNLPKVISYYRIARPKFNHMDILIGESAKELVFEKMFEILDNWPVLAKEKAVCYNSTGV